MGRPTKAEQEAKIIPAHWVEPTEEEVKNGWDIRSLNKYLEDRKRSQLKAVSEPQEPPRPNMQNHQFNPHKIWGRG